MRLLCACLLCALVCARDVDSDGEFTPTVGHPLHIDDGNFSEQDPVKQEPFQELQQQVVQPLPGSAFSLKVQVNDVLTRRYLTQAAVEVYVNYSRTITALTGEDGGVLLHVPYHAGLPLTVVASKDGFICTLLPCKTSRMPIFSSVTMSLHALNQGNIWLFEDSVLITSKTSDASSPPVVRFPKSLLNLTDSTRVTSVKAYLTIPKLTSEQDGFLNTQGIMSSKSGYVSVELSSVAAVSVQLFSGDTELHVSGPIQISLSVPDSCGLDNSNVVPAWFFNRTTGGWMRKGLGKVVSVGGKLMWTFTAPHLGYWIAAPLSSSRGFFGLAVPIDFIFRHSFFLMLLLGGMLVLVICLLVGLIYCCRSSPSKREVKRILAVMKKDQTTSTCDDDVFELSSRNTSYLRDGQNHRDNVIANPGTVVVALECNDLELNTDLNDPTCPRKTSDQIKVPASLADSLFFYNQPVAILHAPAFFHVEEEEEEPEQAQWSKSATLPRAGNSSSAATEPLSKDSFTQTKGPSASQSQAAETEDQLGGLEAAASTNTSRNPFSLPESVSVPGTLNKMGNSRHSAHALGGLSKIPSLQPPRAWFVSLEGKPAAEIHYAVSEQQRRRRPVESRETSLDSGVDMSELNQTPGRRTVTLERNATFVKSTSSSKQAPSE